MTGFNDFPVPPPEVDRHRQALDFDQYLMDSGLGPQLTSEVGRTAFIEQLDRQKFIGLVVDINLQLTGQPGTADPFVHHMNALNDPNEPMVSDITPAPEDKERLLRSTLSAAQMSEVDAFKPLTLATGLLAVHPFSAGNGRTARALYLLLSQDYTPSNTRLYSVLQADGVGTVPFEMRMAAELVYRQLRLANGTHYQTGPRTSPLIPKVAAAIEDRNRNLIVYTPHNRPANMVTEAGLFGLMVTDRYLKDMMPTLLVQKDPQSAAIRYAYTESDGQARFAIDRFLLHATDKDVELVYDLHKKITRQYVQSLVRTVAGLDNVDEVRKVLVNEGSGVSIGTLPQLMHAFAEKIITPDQARNDRLATGGNGY